MHSIVGLVPDPAWSNYWFLFLIIIIFCCCH